MKVRIGFVSNSSVSSFCIYGAEIDMKKFSLENLKCLKINNEEKYISALDGEIKKISERKNKYSGDDKYIQFLKELKDVCSLEKDSLEYIELEEMAKDMFSDMEALSLFLDDGFSFHCTDYNKYVGVSPFSVKDDETGKQFRERVQKSIRLLFGNDIKCGPIEEAYNN